MVLHDFNQFLELSARITFHWQAATNRDDLDDVLGIMLQERPLPERDRQILLDLLEYLRVAYGEQRRRLGTLAVLHPLRATAMLGRVDGPVELLDFVSELLHDKLEDITRESVLATGRSAAEWDAMEARFEALCHALDPQDAWFLGERLDCLTRKDDETYHGYVGRILDRYGTSPGVVRVKLADRLDNSLDLRIALSDPSAEVDFFTSVFKLLYMDRLVRPPEGARHRTSRINGAERLYQLFKNAVVLSLVRQKRLHLGDGPARELFDALVTASLKEAQRVAVHIWTFHSNDGPRERELLVETMDYVRAGGIDRVSSPTLANRLDGLFISVFDQSDKAMRKGKLKELYRNKELMVAAALSFVVIFSSFQCDPDYYVRGITERGLSAHDG